MNLQACSSGGERYLDTVEVGGSKPPMPTRNIAHEAQEPFVSRGKGNGDAENEDQSSRCEAVQVHGDGQGKGQPRLPTPHPHQEVTQDETQPEKGGDSSGSRCAENPSTLPLRLVATKE